MSQRLAPNTLGATVSDDEIGGRLKGGSIRSEGGAEAALDTIPGHGLFSRLFGNRDNEACLLRRRDSEGEVKH